MGGVTSWGGGWKTCPVCGERKFVNDCSTYRYKRNVKRNGKAETYYFNKYTCLLKFDKEQEEKKKRKRSEAAIEQHKRRNEAKRLHEGRQCNECRYCMQVAYGFYDCTVKQNSILAYKPACYRFMEKYPEQKGEET